MCGASMALSNVWFSYYFFISRLHDHIRPNSFLNDILNRNLRHYKYAKMFAALNDKPDRRSIHRRNDYNNHHENAKRSSTNSLLLSNIIYGNVFEWFSCNAMVLNFHLPSLIYATISTCSITSMFISAIPSFDSFSFFIWTSQLVSHFYSLLFPMCMCVSAFVFFIHLLSLSFHFSNRFDEHTTMMCSMCAHFNFTVINRDNFLAAHFPNYMYRYMISYFSSQWSEAYTFLKRALPTNQ